jgi:hypothetical protein
MAMARVVTRACDSLSAQPLLQLAQLVVQGFGRLSPSMS